MRDLLQSIFVTDPNMRISIKDLMKKHYFNDIEWFDLRNKTDLSSD